MRCAIFGCNTNNKENNYDKEISFHNFPKEKNVCKQWIFLCRRKDKFNVKTSRVCSKHFEPDDFFLNPLYEQYGIKLKAHLKQNAVPSRLINSENQIGLPTQRDIRMLNRTLQPK